jgi:hypothetical protein
MSRCPVLRAASWPRHRRPVAELGSTFLAVIGVTRQRLRELAKTRGRPRRSRPSADAPTFRGGLGSFDRTERIDVERRCRPAGGCSPSGHASARRASRSTRREHPPAVNGRRTAEVDVFYSYKTNPMPGAATSARAGHRRRSHLSVRVVARLRLGVPGDRIVYNGPAKSADRSARRSSATSS